PPAELAPMIPIARWYSIGGLAVFGVFALWWAVGPVFPKLLLGSASEHLRLAPSWHRFYLPVLFVLGVGIAQRAINLARPRWTWLLPIARLFANVVGLG